MAGLAVFDPDIRAFDLWINVTIDRDQVEPTIIVGIIERIAPAYNVSGGASEVGGAPTDLGKRVLIGQMRVTVYFDGVRRGPRSPAAR